ncbi:MAG: YceI family protein [Ilumatobacteraceae bacterium]
MNKKLKSVVALAGVAVVLLIAGPWIYINFVKDDAPSALKISDSTLATDSTVPNISDATGSWSVTADSASIVGYRVKEILFGQSTEGVGRTKSVTGVLSIANNSVTAASFSVEMATIMSDAAKRDAQFNGRIMDVASFPTATFTLTAPISLPANATSGDVISAEATGNLTLRGTTKSVTFPIEAQLSGSTFTVVGFINIVFSEWNIPQPGIPGITVDPNGLLEFSLQFSRNN